MYLLKMARSTFNLLRIVYELNIFIGNRIVFVYANIIIKQEKCGSKIIEVYSAESKALVGPENRKLWTESSI